MDATILCVDDEQNQLLLRKLMLERAGYRVLTANSPSQALEIFAAQPIDLVIVDYYMPGMTGLALARTLLQQRKVPVMVLSAYPELPGESIGAANVWITKGTSPEELLTKLADLLTDRRSPADLHSDNLPS
ncbi:MAG TPA: response regulator [Candidatus Binatia bacterium]|jgi:CheY-like chemotaxis protein|nr:response regulator [Candidatus Binatia bacterium]